MTKPTSNYEMVREFHDKFGAETDAEFRRDLIDLKMRLINEELKELRAELYGGSPPFIKPKNINKAKFAKELVDLLYVVYGLGDTFGIPVDEVFTEVHRSNMSKLGDDGKPVTREDGKILKGPNYKQADVERITRHI